MTNSELEYHVVPNIQKTLGIVLRIRNTKKNLVDISFEYQPSRDTTDVIANELVDSGHIVENDVEIMADRMSQMIENPHSDKKIRFRISTGLGPDDSPDKDNLIGYAELNLEN